MCKGGEALTRGRGASPQDREAFCVLFPKKIRELLKIQK